MKSRNRASSGQPWMAFHPRHRAVRPPPPPPPPPWKARHGGRKPKTRLCQKNVAAAAEECESATQFAGPAEVTPPAVPLPTGRLRTPAAPSRPAAANAARRGRTERRQRGGRAVRRQCRRVMTPVTNVTDGPSPKTGFYSRRISPRVCLRQLLKYDII